MESQWGTRILALGEEITKLRQKRQKTTREAERLTRAKVLHRQAQVEQTKWFDKHLRLLKLIPIAQAKVVRLQAAADQAKVDAKTAQDAAEAARIALENAKRRWATATKSQQESEAAKQTAEATKNQAAKALDAAIRKAEEQAEANRQQLEKEEQERLDKKKADAEAAAAKAAEDTAKLEEEVACRLALMHELGVQSGKVGSFPAPGTPGFGLAVKAVTKYVASSIGGKGVSPVIPLGTFGVLKELYTTIRAFFDPRTAPGKLQVVVKLQQVQNKNGQRYLLNDAIAEVEKMAKLMDHWEAQLK